MKRKATITIFYISIITILLTPLYANSKDEQTSISENAQEKASQFFKKAFDINQGNPICPPELLRQKAFFYKKAIEIYPDYAEAWNNLGDVYENLGAFEDALKAYNKAIEISPGFAIAYFGKGDVLYRCRRYEEAIETYKTGIEYSYNTDKENIYITSQRMKAIQSILVSTKERGIIPSSVLVESLDPRNEKGQGIKTRGIDGVGQLPTISLGESILPFSYNSSELLPQAKLQLDELANALRSERLSNASIVLEGYTDEQETTDNNLELSRKRAESVKEYLVAHGINAKHINVKAYGNSRPIIFGETADEAHAANRRVEIRRLDNDIISSDSEKLSLQFGVFHVKGKDSYTLITPGNTVLQSGDCYQIYIRPSSHCYVYLVQESANNKIDWLFPSNFVTLNNPLEAGNDYWIPSRDRFFRLDQTKGEEKIHLIASLRPAEDIEYLIEQTLIGNVADDTMIQIKTRGPVPLDKSSNESGEVPKVMPNSKAESIGDFRTEVDFIHK